MSTPSADRSAPPLLRLGRVDQVRVQVGYRAHPEGPAYQQFLLDLPVPEADGGVPFDERPWLAALEPVLYAGADTPRHYSLHEHRWHTSWGGACGTLDLGLLVTMGDRPATLSSGVADAVAAAFRSLLELAEHPHPPRLTRAVAVTRARRAVADAYDVDGDRLGLTAEQYDADEAAWDLSLRSGEDRYEVTVGFLGRYPGAVRVEHRPGTEVSDSIGIE